jgi:hypothetical protein
MSLKEPDGGTGDVLSRATISRSNWASMTERHPNVLEVLIRQIGQDRKADVVLGKSVGVLPETELL